MTSLNPFLTIGDQLAETLLVHGSAGRAEAWRKAAEMLDKVGIADAGARMRDYPHHFSGGMRQRVMIAMALLGHPKVLIADEPTTALDATIQAQVLDLFQQIKQEYGTALLLVTHNLGIVAGMADRIAVMYAGRVVEYGSADDIFYRPRHPYTLALLRAVPRLGGGTRDGSHEGAHGEEHEGMHEGMHDVTPIPGAPPDLAHLPVGCAFYDRCPFHEEQCLREMPPLVPVGAGHMARCWVDVRGREPAGGPDAGREEPEAR